MAKFFKSPARRGFDDLNKTLQDEFAAIKLKLGSSVFEAGYLQDSYSEIRSPEEQY